LLETARPRTPEMRLSNLNTTVEHAVMLARQQVLSKPIQIEFHPTLEMPEVEHDSDQLHQVLLNLLLNAVQAIEDSGVVVVEVHSETESAVISVTDNGRGIPPEHIAHIFRPFYTTKGNGTGLGLSLTRRIVEQHRGRIEVTSELGNGTRFQVYLPLREAVLSAVS